MLDLNRYLLMEPLAFQKWIAGGATFDEQAAVDVSAGPTTDAIRKGAPMMVDRNGLAIISVVGMTNKRFRYQPWMASYIDTSYAVESAAADPKVKTILLKMDSPGGYVDGIADAADSIAKASAVKRVVAQVDGLTASAAYWMASQASQILAGRLDSVGSIGVLAVMYDVSKMFENEGIKTEVFATGKYKWAGVMGTALTDEQREYIQSDVDQIGDAFVEDVARGRRRSVEDVKKIADGRVFNAEDSLKLGLIDGISSFKDTLLTLQAELASAKARDGRLRNARLNALER